MSRNRFEQIKQFLHCNDNMGIPEIEKINCKKFEHSVPDTRYFKHFCHQNTYVLMNKWFHSKANHYGNNITRKNPKGGL